MADFRAIFEDKAFLGLEEPQISPGATSRPMTTISPRVMDEEEKMSDDLDTPHPDLANKPSSRSLARSLKARLSISRIRKRLSRESARSRLSLRPSKRSSRLEMTTGSSEEEIERRAELRRIRKLRIQEELEKDGFDSDAKSIGTLAASRMSSVKTRVAEMREQLRGSGSVELVSYPGGLDRSAFEW